MATPWWMAPQTQDETFTDFNVPPATQTFPMMIGDFITGMPLTDEAKRKREEEQARLKALQTTTAPVVVEAEKEQPFVGLMGELGVRPQGEAPFQTMTPAREMQIGADNQMVPVLGQGMLDYYEGNVPVGVVERAPYVSGRGFETEGAKQEKQQKKEADRIWGNFAYNPEEAKQRYEDSMKNIYVKSMLLNSIAQLTGGKSQAPAFVAMATKRMEMEEAFRDQSRLQNIQRGIYYTEDGVYDPPKNAQEAFDRALKFGSGAELASKISGYVPKADDTPWNNWYNLKTGEIAQYRTGDKPEGEGWVKGTPAQSGDRRSNVRERLSQDVANFALSGRLQDAIDRYKNHARAGDSYTNEGLLDKQAIAYVFSAIPSDYKITLDKIPSPEEEANIKANNPNLIYYLAEGQIGIFN